MPRRTAACASAACATVALAGARAATVTTPRGQVVRRVEIDPDKGFPDIARRNNVWVRP